MAGKYMTRVWNGRDLGSVRRVQTKDGGYQRSIQIMGYVYSTLRAEREMFITGLVLADVSCHTACALRNL